MCEKSETRMRLKLINYSCESAPTLWPPINLDIFLGENKGEPVMLFFQLGICGESPTRRENGRKVFIVFANFEVARWRKMSGETKFDYL